MALTAVAARRLIMAMPETQAAAHVDREAFRAGGPIFASLRSDGILNLKLNPDMQAMLCEAEPRKFSPVPGGWGRMGFTTVNLKAVSATDLRSALKSAWTESRLRLKRPRNRTALPKPGRADAPRLLSGGNPQVAKGYGDAPVQAYIAAMPGWKRDLGRRLDRLIVQTVPGVHKAVKWNSPFYGIEDGAWFLSFHCFTRYVKVTFFRGTSLKPVPPGQSKHREVRYLDIPEDGLDEKQFVSWVRQASQVPGERM